MCRAVPLPLNINNTDMKNHTVLCSFVILTFLPVTVFSQQAAESRGYVFTEVFRIPTTPVKNQQSTGTCWSFATTSFIETELLRMRKGEYDLSEMFFAGCAYLSKADRYVRYNGRTNFGRGGQAHDVMNVIREYGMVPESVYQGKNYGSDTHNHSELHGLLTAMVEAVVKAGKPTTAWKRAFAAIIQEYLGEFPDTFLYDGKTYTPASFLKMTGFHQDDYLEFTSYTHHPFYSECILEVPDNWSLDKYYNVPVEELMEIIDYALGKGYSVDWDGDVSEREFSHRNHMAIVPAKLWDQKTEEERTRTFIEPEEERAVTQEDRQLTFDNHTSTDDHLMHIIGMATDQGGKKYYITKNSYGTEGNSLGGYLYMSEAYVRLKTIAIMVHREAVPRSIMERFRR